MYVPHTVKYVVKYGLRSKYFGKEQSQMEEIHKYPILHMEREDVLPWAARQVNYCPCLTSWPEDSLECLIAVIGPPR